MNLTVSFVEAVTGFVRVVKLPSNESVEIRQKKRDGLSAINLDTVVTIREHGIPMGQSGVNGSLLVHLKSFYSILYSRHDIERLKWALGDEFEEVRLYLDFISDRELSLLSEETGYEWTREELIWSDHCEMTAVCTPCIMNIAFYDSRPCCNK